MAAIVRDALAFLAAIIVGTSSTIIGQSTGHTAAKRKQRQRDRETEERKLVTGL
jgi:hypothetical protein